MLGSTLSTPAGARAAPLAVDLDGALVKTDVSLEAALALVRRNPLYALACIAWRLRGRAVLAREVGRRAQLDVDSLPFDRALVAYCREQRGLGREIALVSAADERIACAIAAHLGVFTRVVTTGGRREAALLEAELGGRSFYHCAGGQAGWQRAGTDDGAEGADAPPADTFDARRPRWRALAKALRVHQWSKNALVLVPLLTSHRLLDAALAARAAIAFVAFSLCASSVYLMNDLLDLAADRRHATKRARPLASGDLSLGAGAAACALCLAGGAATSLLLPGAFRAVLALYFVLTVAYSTYLKRKLLVDVHLLAGLYTIRVLAGNAATGIAPSGWLLTFSMFFFLSLALLKRFTEVRDLSARRIEAVAGRGYLPRDTDALYGLGTSSGFLGVTILALYIRSPQVVALYRTPAALWLLCPLLLYWVSRMWVLAHRGGMPSDPVLFALRDRVSYCVGLAAGAVMLAATLGLVD
ncbi:MAG: UbiA family prenyltransferase [Polyangiaceae bacterium]|nr:UbiA family prenyltransferase [Polyangiaceae bacterium]